MAMQWLGQQTETWDEAGAEAVSQEAEDRDFGTSRKDFEAYGQVGGAAAATAACTAYPPTTALAPLCGVVGGEVGKFVVGAVYNLISGLSFSGKGISPTQSQLEHSYNTVLAAFDAAYLQIYGPPKHLSPGEAAGAFAAGAPRDPDQNRIRCLENVAPTKGCYAGVLYKSSEVFEIMGVNVTNRLVRSPQALLSSISDIDYYEDPTRARSWSEQLQRITDAIVLDISQQAAVAKARKEAGQKPTPIIVRVPRSLLRTSFSLTSSTVRFSFQDSSKKKSKTVPLLVGATAVGGAAIWWFFFR